MTVPAERTSALIQTRQFLQDLSTMPRVPRAVRDEAKALLRHYPCDADVEIAHNGAPDWFGPVAPLTLPRGAGGAANASPI